MPNVYNRDGHPQRGIPIPHRNPFTRNGQLAFQGNVAVRTEGDKDELSACLGAGHLVIELTDFECDVLDDLLPAGLFQVGDGVEVQYARSSPFRLDVKGDGWAELVPNASYEPPRRVFTCCGETYDSVLDYGRHRRHKHPWRDEAA